MKNEETFSLNLTKLKATLYFPQYNLPPFLGNKFRGGFGNVLLKAVCSYLKPACNICKSADDCLYHALYVRDKQQRGKSQPVRPIVFIPPFFGKWMEGRGELDIQINIFGDYVKFLPHIVYGLRFLGKIGLNPTSRFELIRIKDALSNREIYDGESVRADELTTIDLADIPPLKLDRKLRIDFITPFDAKQPIELPFLLHLVRKRLILYVNEYGSGEVFDYECEAKIIESRWQEHKLHHRSKREGSRFFYGITGWAEYEAELDKNALKLLSIGELIGAGAKASFGMGFYVINSPKVK